MLGVCIFYMLQNHCHLHWFRSYTDVILLNLYPYNALQALFSYQSVSNAGCLYRICAPEVTVTSVLGAFLVSYTHSERARPCRAFTTRPIYIYTFIYLVQIHISLSRKYIGNDSLPSMSRGSSLRTRSSPGAWCSAAVAATRTISSPSGSKTEFYVCFWATCHSV